MHSERPQFAKYLDHLPAWAAVTSMAAGSSALIGWQGDIAAMKSILPGLVAMNPVTALSFILCGLSLLALRHVPEHPLHQRVGDVLSVAVALVGLSKLCDVLGISHFHLDQLLFHDKLAGVGALPPNRMAPNTALNFALIGIALLTLRIEKRQVRPAQYIALLTAGMSLLAVLGYALDVHQLYGLTSFIPMALNTALTFGVLSVGILLAYPARGITAVLVAEDAGGAMARRVLPFALIVPAVLAWIRTQAQREGILPADPGVSIMVFTSIVLLAGFIWFDAARLSRTDADRKRAVAELEGVQAELELRVRVRTAELEETNHRLRREVEERIQIAEALRQSQEHYRLLFFANPHPMWVYDRKTLGFIAVNEAACQLYGYSADEFAQMTIKDIRPPEDVPALLVDLSQERPSLNAPREWRHCRKDGSLIDVEIASHTLQFAGRDAVLVLAHDVTDRRQLEAQLRQSQKMEAVGMLAGGVAHDFNNLLTAIMGYSQLMRPRLGADVKALSDIDEILGAAERAAALTRQLLAFSRQQILEPQVLNLNAVVTDLDKMLRRLIGEDIDLLTAPATELGRVKADPGQIEQVLMNLVVNARDAMPEGGKLTIETANVDLDHGYARARIDLKPGRYVMLAVSDTGCGMTPEVVGRVFEPFYTTKEVGKGTGLGLSTVHGIVKQSGGHIEVYSETGQGTTFKIYLPRVEGVAEAPRSLATTLECQGGGESVLLVEDEEVIRRVVRASLELHGYTVIEAGDGSEAIAICEQRDQLIDLLITDVVMPLMSGPELVQRIATIRPDLRVLFISGYTDRALVHQGLRGAGTAFLQKPFTPDVLVQKVRQVLDEPRQAAA